MGEKVERVSGSHLRGYNVGATAVSPVVHRVINSMNVPEAISFAGNISYSVESVGKGGVIRVCGAANRTDTLPDGDDIIQGVANQFSLPNDHDAIEWFVQNADPVRTVTLLAGSAMTLQGDTVIPPLQKRVLYGSHRPGVLILDVIAYNPNAFPGQVAVSSSVIATAGDVTYLTSQYVNGYIARNPNGAGRTDDTPTGAQLDAYLPQFAVGDYFDTTVKNTASTNLTVSLGANTGITIILTIDVNQNETMVIRTVKTGVGTYDVIKLGPGP